MDEKEDKMSGAKTEIGSGEAKVLSAEAKVNSAEAKLDSDEAIVGSAEAKVNSAEAKIGSAEAKVDNDEVKVGSSEAKVDTDEAKVGSAEAKVDSDEAIVGSAKAKVDSDEAEVGSAEGGTAAIGEGDITAVVSKLSNLHLESTDDNEDTNDTDQSTSTTDLNLSGMCKGVIDPSIFGEHLTNLTLSHNQLKEVPAAVLALKNIVRLDLSHNLIELFNDTPMFINTLEELSLAYNSLMAPPLWVWRDAPLNLKCLNISENENVFSELKKQKHTEYYYCWLNIYKIVMFNCRIHEDVEVMYTIAGVHELILGGEDITGEKLNKMYEFPMEGITCVEARVININNCKIYDINKGIICYSSLTHLDIGRNYIINLPDELGDLPELEVLIMSYNKLQCLPDTMSYLLKLRILLICENQIEQLPENLLNALPELKCVDLYNNCFDTLPEGHEKLDEFDISQNYAVEPDLPEYVQKRTDLRNNHTTYDRKNGIKIKPGTEEEYDDTDGDDVNSEELPAPKVVPIPGFIPEKN